MKVMVIYYNEHQIAVHDTMWGEEKVYYDSKLMSSKTSLGGAFHVFTTEENGELVEYEVQLGIRPFSGIGVNVWRNRVPLVAMLEPFPS